MGHLDLKGLEKDKAHPGCLVPWTEASWSPPRFSVGFQSRAGWHLHGPLWLPGAPASSQSSVRTARPQTAMSVLGISEVGGAAERQEDSHHRNTALSLSAASPQLEWPMATLSLGISLRSVPHGPQPLPGRVLSPHCFPDSSLSHLPLPPMEYLKPLSCGPSSCQHPRTQVSCCALTVVERFP